MTELEGELADGLMMYMNPISRMPRMLKARDQGAEKGGRQGSDIEINFLMIDPAKPGETYQEAFERTLKELAPSE